MEEAQFNRKPSEVTDVYNLHAKSPKCAAPSGGRGGKWILMPLDIHYRDDDGNTELDRVWFKVKKLTEAGVLYHSKCTTALVSPMSQTEGMITTFTPDYSNIKEVRQIADALRQAIQYNCDIHYKTNNATRMKNFGHKGSRNVSLYKHTPLGNLFIKQNNRWRILTEQELELNPNTTARPSEVKTSGTVWAVGPNLLDFGSRIGKWMIMDLDSAIRDNDGNTELDRKWFEVKKLVEQGVLYDSRCTTALFIPLRPNEGLITCYTPDYIDVKEVRRVADAFRNAVSHDYEIHYKTDEATVMHKYNWNGERRISIYKHKPDYSLYFPDYISRTDHHIWRLLRDDLEVEPQYWDSTTYLRSPSEETENLPEALLNYSSERPSQVEDKSCVWALNQSDRPCMSTGRSGRWVLHFKNSAGSKDGAIEADIAWSMVQELVSDGKLHDSKCSTALHKREKFTIISYTPDCADVKEVWRVANTIRSKVLYEQDIFYKLDSTVCSGNYIEGGNVIYKHTKDCDLYKKERGIWKKLGIETIETPRTLQAELTQKRPSDIKDEEFVWAMNTLDPPYVNTGTGGKWILSFKYLTKDEDGVTEADKAWFTIQELVRKGELHDSKCSTAKHSEESAAIICYTRDFTDVKEVWRVADAIRAAMTYDKVIFYKKDSTPQEKEGECNIDKFLYKHTYLTLYKKTAEGWEEMKKMMNPTKNEEKQVVRPSEVNNRMWLAARREDIPLYRDCGKRGKWCLYFDKDQRDERGDTEFDKAWYKVEMLIKEGSIYNSECSTAASNPASTDSKGIILCYTPDHSDTADVKRVAEAIATELGSTMSLEPFYYKIDAVRRGLCHRLDEKWAKYKFDPLTGVLLERNWTSWTEVDERRLTTQRTDTLNPCESTLNPCESTLNPCESTLNPCESTLSFRPKGWGKFLQI